MRAKNSSWGKQRSTVECCHGCVPPKRYPGCGANCKEYKEQKEKSLVNKKREKDFLESHPTLSIHDFNKY